MDASKPNRGATKLFTEAQDDSDDELEFWLGEVCYELMSDKLSEKVVGGQMGVPKPPFLSLPTANVNACGNSRKLYKKGDVTYCLSPGDLALGIYGEVSPAD